jgi:hypothetical protein
MGEITVGTEDNPLILLNEKKDWFVGAASILNKPTLIALNQNASIQLSPNNFLKFRSGAKLVYQLVDNIPKLIYQDFDLL